MAVKLRQCTSPLMSFPTPDPKSIRNHSHRSRNKLILDGGSSAPSPGKMPRGANQIEMNPASSSIPSDWYDENTCSVDTNDRNTRVQIAVIQRGHTFAVSSREETSPTTTATVSAPSPDRSQNTLGVYQKCVAPGRVSLISLRYEPTGNTRARRSNRALDARASRTPRRR